MQVHVRAAQLVSVRTQAPARRDDHPPVVAGTIVATSRSNAQQRVSHPRLTARKPCEAAQTAGDQQRPTMLRATARPALPPPRERHRPTTRTAGTRRRAHHTAVTCGGASIASGAPPGAGSMASRAGSRSGRSAGPSAVGRPWLASKNRSVCREWAS